MGKPVGVALSGGGHRAALWASGALLALTDTGTNVDLVSVASVSGGSLANGLAAAAPQDLASASTAELENALRPGIRQWASTGLFFTGPPTDGYVAALLFQVGLLVATVVAAIQVFAAVGRGWTTRTVLAVAVGSFVVTVVAALAANAKLPGRYRSALPAGAATSIVLGLIGLLAARRAHGWMALVVGLATVSAMAAAGALARTWFIRRSEVVDAALAKGLFCGPDAPRPLASLATKAVHHVFCATNLVTGNHLYLSPRLVYGDDAGSGPPAPSLPLATAVQSAACLPGAFGPRALPGHLLGAGLEDVVLMDGGVYDNMADQWELGFENRAERFANHAQRLSAFQTSPAQQLVVVNASKAFSTEPFPCRGIVGEVVSLLRCKDVLYDQTTATRRRYLVDLWDANAEAGDGPTGVLVHIAQPPGRVPTTFLDSPDEGQRKRAGEALKFLDRLDGLNPTAWSQVTDDNASVPTTLGPIGMERSAHLLHHAYVLCRINLYVVLGRGSLPETTTPDAEVVSVWSLNRFTDLVVNA